METLELQHLDRGRHKPLCGPSEDGPNELTFEQIAITGGYANPDQSLPCGTGFFSFRSLDLEVDDFSATDADSVLRHVALSFGAADIVRGFGYLWTVEKDGLIVGEIRAENCGGKRCPNGGSFQTFNLPCTGASQ